MPKMDRKSQIVADSELFKAEADLRLSLTQVVKAISEEILQCDSVGVFLAQEDGTFQGYVSKPKAINGMTIDQIIVDPAQDAFYREIIETRKHIYINDTSKDSRPNRKTIEALNIKSILGLPIYYEEEVFGLVSLFIYNTPMDLTEREIYTVEAYVNIAAVAIRNGRLLSRNQNLLLEHQLLLTASREESMRAHDRFLKVFKFNPVAMSLISRSGIYLDVNDSWLKLFEVKREDVIGKQVTESIVVKDHPSRLSFYLEYKDKEVRNIEFNIETSSGQERKVLYNSESIELKGEPCKLNVFNDVTELKQLEKELSRLDRLNIVAQMAAGMGHEIRNPLTTVRGFLQLIKEKKMKDNPSHYYDIMIDELDRANAIISEFLLLAKEKTCELEAKNLNAILDAIQPLLMADSHTWQANLEIIKGDIPDIPLDDKQIRQLIYNLVRNGLEALKSGGNIKLQTFKGDDEVVLMVEDDGTGVPASLLEKIGDPFFTTKDNGTGLGLAICHSIAQNHNAILEIQRKKKGTKVLVRFKFERAEKA